MMVWNCGGFTEMKIGQKVFVGRCCSGRSYVGEYGKFVRATKRDLVFVTDSGVTVKTAADNLNKVHGKAGQQGYFVSLNTDRDNDPECMISATYIF